MMSFRVSAILPDTPVQSSGMRTEKSPFFKAIKVVSSSLTSNCSPISVMVFIAWVPS